MPKNNAIKPNAGKSTSEQLLGGQLGDDKEIARLYAEQATGRFMDKVGGCIDSTVAKVIEDQAAALPTRRDRRLELFQNQVRGSCTEAAQP